MKAGNQLFPAVVAASCHSIEIRKSSCQLIAARNGKLPGKFPGSIPAVAVKNKEESGGKRKNVIGPVITKPLPDKGFSKVWQTFFVVTASMKCN